MAALDRFAAKIDFNHRIDQFPLTDVIKRGAEEFPLESRFGIGNYDHKPRVDRRLGVKRQKIRPVIRDECVVARKNKSHQLPVFRAAQTEVVHVIGSIACGVSEIEEGCMEALVNQQLWQ